MRCETTSTRGTARRHERTAITWARTTRRPRPSDAARSGSCSDRSTAPRSHSVRRAVVGEHCFRGFAVQGTAPADDDHRCTVRRAEWRTGLEGSSSRSRRTASCTTWCASSSGTMIDVALGRRPAADVETLLARERQLRRVSARAAARALPRPGLLPGRSLSLRGMKIYLATASTDDVAWGAAHGMLDGVITSPGLLADDADAEMRDAPRRAVPPRARSRSSRRSTPSTRRTPIATARSSAKISDQIVVQLPLRRGDARRDAPSAGRRRPRRRRRRCSTPRRRCSRRGPARRASSSPLDRLDAAGHDGVTTSRGRARRIRRVATRNATSSRSTQRRPRSSALCARRCRCRRRRRGRCAAPCSFIRSPTVASTSSSATSRVFAAHGLSVIRRAAPRCSRRRCSLACSDARQSSAAQVTRTADEARASVPASRRTAITEAVARVAPAVVTVQTEVVQRVAGRSVRGVVRRPVRHADAGGTRHGIHHSRRRRDRHQRARRRRRDAHLRHAARRHDLSRARRSAPTRRTTSPCSR